MQIVGAAMTLCSRGKTELLTQFILEHLTLRESCIGMQMRDRRCAEECDRLAKNAKTEHHHATINEIPEVRGGV